MGNQVHGGKFAAYDTPESFLNGSKLDSPTSFGPALDVLIKNKEWTLIAKLLNENKRIASYRHPTSHQYPLSRALCRQVSSEILIQLIELNPDACKEHDHNGWYPLHHAACNLCSIDVIEKLLSIYPQAAQIPDPQGQTCLHFAAKFKLSTECFRVLLAAYPGGAHHKTRLGGLPLHFAAQHRQSLEVIEILLEANPLAMKESLEGQMPIHYACKHRADASVIKAFLVASGGEAAYERATNLVLPLHICAGNKAELDAVELIAEAFPSAVGEKDRTGRLPIHYALERQAPFSVVRYLLSCDADTAGVRGHGGDLALHVALEKQLPSSFILDVLNAYPAAAQIRDMYGMLPLVRAINNQAPHDQLSALLHANPRATAEVDDFLRSPLHYAVSKKLDYKFVVELLDYYPEAAAEADKNGQLPLHIAIKRSSCEGTIKALFTAYPKGISQLDSYGLTPLHHAIETEGSLASVELLLTLDVQCACDRFGMQLPLHLAIELKRFDLISLLLDAYPEGAADTESECKRLPLQAAIHARAPYHLLMALFQADPTAAATVYDSDGLMAIHYVIKYHEPVELVSKLIALNPEIVFIQNLPIYLSALELTHFKKKQLVLPAADSNKILTSSPLRNIRDRSVDSPSTPTTPSRNSSFRKRLIPVPSPYPASYFEDIDGVNITGGDSAEPPATPDQSKSNQAIRGKTLLHYAIEINDAADDVVAEILRHTMPISYTDQTVNPRHNYCWSYILAETNDKYSAAVELVLEFYDLANDLNLIQRLADTPDELGRKAIDIATPRCQQTLLRRLYFFVRYELFPLPYKHISDQSIVQLARDHYDNKRIVAMKFMRNRLHFDREVHVRTNTGLHTDYAIELLRWHDGDNDPAFKEEVIRKGKAEFPYCIVMVAAERELVDAFYHENFSGGRNWSMLSLIAKQITEAVGHLHEWGLIHGDLRPANVVREGGRMKLIGLGTVVSFQDHDILAVGDIHVSAAFLPPELFTSHASTSAYQTMLSKPPPMLDQEPPAPILQPSASTSATIVGFVPGDNRSVEHDLFDETRQVIQPIPATAAIYSSKSLRSINFDVPETSTPKQAQGSILCGKTGLSFEDKSALSTRVAIHGEIRSTFMHDRLPMVEYTEATRAIDLWSIGALLFQLCSGESLFLPSVGDTIDTLQLTMLADWTDSLKEQRLSRIKNPAARNLLHQLLSKDPAKRPPTEVILKHPFITGYSPARYAGMPAEYDICIVFRKSIRDIKKQVTIVEPAEDDELEDLEDDETDAMTAENEAQAAVPTGPALSEKLLVCEHMHVRWLYRLLRSKGMRVVFCNENGTNLIKSRAAVVILSRFAVNIEENSFAKLTENSACDPYLLQLKLALELPSFSILEGGVFCLRIGDRCDAIETSQLPDSYEAVDMSHAVDNPASLSNSAYAILRHGAYAPDTSPAGTRHRKIRSSQKTDIIRSCFDYGKKDSDDIDHCDGAPETSASTSEAAPEHGSPSENIDVSPSALESLVPIEELTFGHYFQSYRGEQVGRHGGCHPNFLCSVAINAIDEAVRQILDKEALGAPYLTGLSLYDVVKCIVSMNPIDVSGSAMDAWVLASEDITRKLNDAYYRCPTPAATRYRSPDGARANGEPQLLAHASGDVVNQIDNNVETSDDNNEVQYWDNGMNSAGATSRPFTASGVRALSPLSPGLLRTLGFDAGTEAMQGISSTHGNTYNTPRPLTGGDTGSNRLRSRSPSPTARDISTGRPTTNSKKPSRDIEPPVHFTSVAFSDNNAAMTATIALLEQKISVKSSESAYLSTEVLRLNELLEIRMIELNDLRAMLNMKPYDGL